MKRTIFGQLAIGALVLATSGCEDLGAADEDPCDIAIEVVAECRGEDDARAFANQCTPETAAVAIAADCDGKADSPLSAQTAITDLSDYSDFLVYEAYDHVFDPDERVVGEALRGLVTVIGGDNNTLIAGRFTQRPGEFCSNRQPDAALGVTRLISDGGAAGGPILGLDYLTKHGENCEVHYVTEPDNLGLQYEVECVVSPSVTAASVPDIDASALEAFDFSALPRPAVRCSHTILEEPSHTVFLPIVLHHSGAPVAPQPGAPEVPGDLWRCAEPEVKGYIERLSRSAPATYAEYAEFTKIVADAAFAAAQSGVAFRELAEYQGLLPGSETALDDVRALCITEGIYIDQASGGMQPAEGLADPANFILFVWDMAGLTKAVWSLSRALIRFPSRELAKGLVHVADDGPSLRWTRRPQWLPCPHTTAGGPCGAATAVRELSEQLADYVPFAADVSPPLPSQYLPDDGRVADEIAALTGDIMGQQLESLPSALDPTTWRPQGVHNPPLGDIVTYERVEEALRAVLPDATTALARGQYIPHRQFVEDFLALFVDRLTQGRPIILISQPATETTFRSLGWLRSILEEAVNSGSAFQPLVNADGSVNAFDLANGGIDGMIRVWDLGADLSDQTASVQRLQSFFDAQDGLHLYDVVFQVVDDAAYSGGEARGLIARIDNFLARALDDVGFANRQGFNPVTGQFDTDLGLAAAGDRLRVDVVVPYMTRSAADLLDTWARGGSLTDPFPLARELLSENSLWIPLNNGTGQLIPTIADLAAAAGPEVRRTWDYMSNLLGVTASIANQGLDEPVQWATPLLTDYVFALSHKIAGNTATDWYGRHLWSELARRVDGVLPDPPY